LTNWHKTLAQGHDRWYYKPMKKTTNNPYVQQILDKGRDYVPTPAPKVEYPRTVHGRVFETKAEYDEALADFLNGL
jgi:hypothetical protein